MLAKANLPEVLAYGVYIGEIVAPVLLIVGIWTRLAAALIAINMIFAVALVGLPQLFKLNQYGGYALELRGDLPVHRRRAGAHRRRPLQHRRPLRADELGVAAGGDVVEAAGAAQSGARRRRRAGR